MSHAYDSDQKVAVVVVGCSLNGLGVVRSLARERVPIVAVDCKRIGPALWSRHVRGHLIRSFVGRKFVDDMARLGAMFERPPVLLLTDEDAVHSVSENREELAKWFCFCLPEDRNVKLMSNKSSFHEFAWQHGFPVPRSVILQTQADLGLLAELRFPCVLKPDDKRYVLTGKKDRAVRVQTLSEAREHAVVMLSSPGGIVAQEWIEGPGSNIHFTLFYRGAGGEVVSVFTGRKILSDPPDIGNTAICVAADEARDVLEPMTLDFAERAGMVGMGSMEYKWDDNYKEFVMIEPTVGRTDWQEEIATLCGVNIPAAAYRYELGFPPLPAQMNQASVAWRATFLDRPPPRLTRAGTRMIDGYFRWNDPLPALQFYCAIGPLRRVVRGWREKKRTRIARQILREAKNAID
ncbi:carboxylate--amine ligase [Burkholderia ambifaria]|uniref:carboxylate--amine ligase n=1 Tax=Burkholderia ambifaria TaxID=152480 RepID=UPI001E2D94B0|nr:carboxylate--amine ligase [Burkholderia ambifaria]UEP26281.1 carboxylate--amine ligase [Burkholderia ambifaria]